MIIGEVIHGDGIGKQLGYPTANLDISVKKKGLAPGVYAAYAFLHKKKYQAALAIQSQPEKVEVHLLDYFGPDFYGAELSVEAGEKVGEMKKYRTRERLIRKISEDIKKVRKYIAKSQVY